MKVNKPKVIKGTVITVIVAAVCVGGYFAYQKFFKTKPTSNVTYTRARAIKGTMEVKVPGSGTISSAVTQDVISQNNGTISSISVKQGDTIKQGDPIASISDTQAASNVTKAQNNVTQQNLALSKLKKSLDTLNVKSPVTGTVKAVNISAGDDLSSVGKAYPNGIIVITVSDGKDVPVSAQNGIVGTINVSVGTAVNKGDTLFKLNADDINSNISQQNLQVQQAQSDLASAQQALATENITAPVAGTVAAVDFTAGAAVQSGKPVVTIVDTTQLVTVVAVDELDISKVKTGQKGEVTLDALPDKTYSGTVQSVASIGKTSNGVTTYDVAVSVEAAPEIKIGMTTNVNIIVSSKENVIMLPIEAVQTLGKNKFVITTPPTGTATSSTTRRSSGSYQQSGQQSTQSGQQGSQSGQQSSQRSSQQGSQRMAFSSNNMKMVQVGLTNENYVEILSGVSEGDTVYIPVYKSSSTSTQTNTNAFSGTRAMMGGGGNFTRGGN